MEATGNMKCNIRVECYEMNVVDDWTVKGKNAWLSIDCWLLLYEMVTTYSGYNSCYLSS